MDNTNETKTFREWLEMLPEPYRTQAIDTCTAEGLIDAIVDFEKAVLGAFIWPCGKREYWHNVNQRWLSGEFLPKAESRKHRYPWHEAPEWATCAATDQEGNAYWYGYRPAAPIFWPKCLKIPGKFDTTDWQNSLEIRPAEFQKPKAQ